MAYTLFPDDDKAQVDGTAIDATSTVLNGMTVYALGTAVPSDGPVTANVQLGDRRDVFGSQILQSKNAFGVYHGDSTALTSVADNGSGFCRFTLVAHGLEVGDVINVINSTSGNVNGVQKVTAVPTSSTFDTDKAYVASAAAGDFRMTEGPFASMTVGNYIMKGGVAGSVAGGQYTVTGFGSDYGIRRSIHKVEHVRTRRVATAIRAGYWNMFSGEFTTAPTVGDDISDIGADHAATPSYAVPGELTFRVTGQPDSTHGITTTDYPPKTN